MQFANIISSVMDIWVHFTNSSGALVIKSQIYDIRERKRDNQNMCVITFNNSYDYVFIYQIEKYNTHHYVSKICCKPIKRTQEKICTF